MASSRFPILRGLDALVSRLQDNIAAFVEPAVKALSNTPILGAAQPPWTKPTLLNGFTVAPGSPAPAYQVDCLGIVRFRGRAAHAAGAGPLTQVFVVPLEARPGVPHLFAVAGVAAVQNVIADERGNVTALNAVAAGGQISFEFSFQAGG